MRAVHYVGFKDDRYWNAFRIWGGPVVIHRWWDRRAAREIAEDEVVIFAEGDWQQKPRRFNAPDIDEGAEPSRAAARPAGALG
jgi:hypothetical protein